MRRNMRKAVEEGMKATSKNDKLDLYHSDFCQLFEIQAEDLLRLYKAQGISITMEEALEQGLRIVCKAYPAIGAAYYAGLAVGLRQRKKKK